jgi:hypothetical protein
MIQNQNNTLKQDNKIILEHSKVRTIDNKHSIFLDTYFKNLQHNLGCTYILYIYEDTFQDKKIIYSSNWQWQHLLVGEKLINECPVFKAATEGLTNKNSILLPWNHIHCKTSREKDVTLLRVEHNIANGIGVCLKNGPYREGIGFGADIKDTTFYERLISGNLIYKIMTKIRLMILTEINTSIKSNIVLH